MVLRRRLVAPVVMLAVTAMLAACQTAPPPAGSARSCSVGIVGDSLTVGSQPYWNKAFGDRGCKVQFVNARYSNLHVYDWNNCRRQVSAITPVDRIHLTDGGYNLRAHMIANFVSGR